MSKPVQDITGVTALSLIIIIVSITHIHTVATHRHINIPYFTRPAGSRRALTRDLDPRSVRAKLVSVQMEWSTAREKMPRDNERVRWLIKGYWLTKYML
eukprot:scaffold20291_cov15-Prasinocladus_malaysianus.AAC.1